MVVGAFVGLVAVVTPERFEVDGIAFGQGRHRIADREGGVWKRRPDRCAATSADGDAVRDVSALMEERVAQ